MIEYPLDTRMNILFFYESANQGGQQTQTYNLVKQLAERGHSVSWVYLYGTGMEDSFSAYATIERLPTKLSAKDYLYKPWKLFIIARGLIEFCRSHDVQVIISGSGIGSLMCGWAARWVGIRHYRLVGGSLVQVEKTLYRFYRWIRIDSVIDGYFGWPAVFKELAVKGVPDRKFVELNNAVDTDMFCPLDPARRAEIRSSLGIEPDDLVIGWIGRVAANMQVWATVELGAKLRESGFDRFKLLFVGGGPDFDELKAMVKRCGLVPYSIFTEWVPMEEVNRFVNVMDIVPLLESDPHGGSIVREAMACGRVALSVDGASGTQRRFMPPDCSILVSPEDYVGAAADAVLRLARDRSAMESMGRNARAYAREHMSFDAQANTLLEAIQQRGPIASDASKMLADNDPGQV